MSGDLATPVRTFSHGCSGGQPRWSEGRSAPLTCLLGVVPAEDNFSGLFIDVLFGPFEAIVQLFRENYQNLPLGLLGIALVMEPSGISGVQQFTGQGHVIPPGFSDHGAPASRSFRQSGFRRRYGSFFINIGKNLIRKYFRP